MRAGLSLPIFGELADPGLLADLAVDAEAAGWDGVFVWDHVYYREPVEQVTDPWIAMAAIAVRTSRILTGPMVTPLARRRPQVVARQLVALDRLSSGRTVFGIGLGLDGSGREFVRFGEETDDRRRAAMFDEALDLVRALLTGERVDHHGPHYTAEDVRFLPRPTNGDIPIWAVARWPNRRPLHRAATCDGLFLIDVDDPADLAAVVGTIADLRPGGAEGFEVVVLATPGADPAAWSDAGATWWMTTFDPFTVTAATVRAAIAAGPASETQGRTTPA